MLIVHLVDKDIKTQRDPETCPVQLFLCPALLSLWTSAWAEQHFKYVCGAHFMKSLQYISPAAVHDPNSPHLQIALLQVCAFVHISFQDPARHLPETLESYDLGALKNTD